MIWIILAALGIPIWFVLGGLAAYQAYAAPALREGPVAQQAEILRRHVLPEFFLEAFGIAERAAAAAVVGERDGEDLDAPVQPVGDEIGSILCPHNDMALKERFMNGRRIRRSNNDVGEQ